MMGVPDIHSIGLSPNAMAAAWIGHGWGCLVARMDDDDLLTQLVLNHDGNETLLWEGAIAVTPQICPVSDSLALCLFPGQALFAIRREEEQTLCTELHTRGGMGTPTIICPQIDAVWAAFDQANGQKLCQLSVEAAHYSAGSAIKLPKLAQGSRISTILSDGTGTMTLIADNLREGFELWQLSSGAGWSRKIEKGGWRYAFNAAVTALLSTPRQLYLATGLGAQAQANLLGMPAKPEFLSLDEKGNLQMIGGEPRFSPSGLIRPLAGNNTALSQSAGLVTAMVNGPEGPCLAFRKHGGSSVILCLASDGTLNASEPLDGEVLALARGDAAHDGKVIAALSYSQGFRIMEQ